MKKGKLRANAIAKDRMKGCKSNDSGRPKLSEGKKEGMFCNKVAAEKAASKGRGVIGI